ncbi:MAG: DUF2325 domain-containing protein [Thermodesulfobacteriota bacterium]
MELISRQKQPEKNKSDNGIENNPPLSVRLRFWEVDCFFKCPVIGMCLTFSEQKKLLKKSGFSYKNASPFDIHEKLVASAQSENPLSKRIDELVDRKYGKLAQALLMLEENEFMAKFESAFEKGDITEIYWAAAVHPSLCFEFKRQIVGRVHMTMHRNSEENLKIKLKLEARETELERTGEEAKTARQYGRNLKKENQRLKQENADMAAALSAARSKNRRLEEEISSMCSQSCMKEFDKQNRKLKNKVSTLSEKLKQTREQQSELENENRGLTFELEQVRALNDRLTGEIREVTEELASLSRCDSSCPSYDLCEKRVLIVGGMTRMESLYRRLIKENGGVLEYHDGYIKQREGVKQLECRLKRSDLVLCPVNCNSHSACSIVKNLGKKHGKTVHMLAQSSLSSISRTIREEISMSGTVN